MRELTTEHSEPVNMTAVRVTRFRGEHYHPAEKKITCAHSETPLPTRPIDSDPQLAGIRFGYFTVIGLGLLKRDRNRGNPKPAAWVVRCDCGNYEHRTARAIRNPSNHVDRCQACRQVQYEKRAFENGRRVR